MPLKNPKDKNIIFRDKELEKYLKVVTDCINADIFEAALILSQTKLEQILKRILKFELRMKGVNVPAIDEYLLEKGQSIGDLTDKAFKDVYNKSCYQLIVDNLIGLDEEKFFPPIWQNFVGSTKNSRNSLIHTGKSIKPGELIFSTKSNFYLIDLIRLGFKQHSKIDILGNLTKIKGFKKSKYTSVAEYLANVNNPQLGKKKFDFGQLKKNTLAYHTYLEKKNAP